MSHTKRRFVIDCDVLSVLASLKFCSIQKIPPLQIVIKFIYCDMLFESVYVNECLSDPIKSVFILVVRVFFFFYLAPLQNKAVVTS